MAIDPSIQKLLDLARDVSLKVALRDRPVDPGEPESSHVERMQVNIQLARQLCPAIGDMADAAAKAVPLAAPQIVEMKDALLLAMSTRGRLERVDKARAALEAADYQAAGNSAKAEGKGESEAGQSAQLALEELLGPEADPILKIARSQDSAEDRYRAICGIDRRLVYWKSTQIARVLSIKKPITSAAIRQTDMWRIDRAKVIEAERELREDRDG